MKAIAEHYVKKIIPSADYRIKGVCNDPELLYPEFKKDIENLITEYQKYNDHDIVMYETYRSNSLQLIYYNRGASKIKTNSMHHYGVAVDLLAKVGNGVSWDILDYPLLRTLASNMGIKFLKWEACHFQAIPVDQQDELRTAVSAEVIKFQKDNGLVPDGIVGPKTILKARELFI